MDNKFVFHVEFPEKLINIFSIIFGYLFIVTDTNFVLV